MRKFCDIYIALWCVYNLQGILYRSGSFVSQGLFVLLLIVSIAFFVVVVTKYKVPIAFRYLSILVVVFGLYGVYIMMFGNGVKEIASYNYLKNIYLSLLPFFPFYYFTKRGVLSSRHLQAWALVFVAIAICQFYREQRDTLLEASMMGIMREEFTNNAGYIVLSILPLVPLFSKRSFIQYGMISIGMAYAIIGIKRGAIVLGALCSIWLVYEILRSNNGKAIVKVLFSIAFIVGSVYLVNRLLLTSDYFYTRIEQTLEGSSSGRDYLYRTSVHYLLHEINALQFLFGSGADATLRIIGQYAHNDWLEIAINNGFIVLVLYVLFWGHLFVWITKNKRDPILFQILFTFFLFYFLKSFISMTYNGITIYATSALGYAVATLENRD